MKKKYTIGKKSFETDFRCEEVFKKKASGLQMEQFISNQYDSTDFMCEKSMREIEKNCNNSRLLRSNIQKTG